MFWRIHGLIKIVFRTFNTELCALHSSHEVLSGELGVSIVKSKTFGANCTASPPFWADGTEEHKTALICIDTVESKYRLLNKCKVLFDLVVHQQQHLYCFWKQYSSFGKV
jgi:hypothetical protein